mgnify:CR=1 FL=1
MDHPSVPYHNPKANVHSILEARTLSSSITRFIVDCCCCNDDQLSTLDFSYWESIKDIEIGSQSFRYVIGVDIVGLNQLERVVIGRNCFSQEPASLDKSILLQFTVKDCERLKELRIGRLSFCYYGMCEIDNNASLEVIEMGKMDEASELFVNGDLFIASTLWTRE